MKRRSRIKRHIKVRKKILGTENMPRLAIFRANKHIYAQIIDDKGGKTLFSASDHKQKGTKKERAYEVGQDIAKKVLKAKIKTVVFDRGGFLYHGRVAQLAKGAREGGLEF